MTNSTMIAPGGFFFLEGDPLGVRALEEQLAWRHDGPLPEWLSGADPEEDVASSIHERMAAATLMLPTIPAPPPPTLVVPTPAFAPRSIRPVETKHNNRLAEEPSCDDSIAFEGVAPNATVRIAATVGNDAALRRRLSTYELADASHCFVAEAAGVLWAVALDRICYVSRKSRAGTTIDLRSGGKTTSQGSAGVVVTLFSDVAIRFDRSVGSRVVQWSALPASSDAPPQAIARAVLSGEPLLLFDAQAANVPR